MGMYLTSCVIFWRHKRQTEEDIAVCECQYDILDPESPCGDRCLNLLTQNARLAIAAVVCTARIRYDLAILD
jgi:hypothetical protein